MSALLQVSQTYSGRDKLMRTAGYTATFLTGGFNPQGKIVKDLTTIARSMSAGRMMMRFFDDLPMLYATIGSIKSQEKDFATKILAIIGNFSIQAYFPIEKIAWAIDNDIIRYKAGAANWWSAGTASWAIFIVANLLKIIRTISLMRAERVRLIKTRKLESPDRSSDAEVEFHRAMAESKRKEFAEVVNFVKLAADLVMAVNWLPAGFLWAGKISPAKTAFFGVISSIIGMLQLMIQAKAKAKSS